MAPEQRMAIEREFQASSQLHHARSSRTGVPVSVRAPRRRAMTALRRFLQFAPRERRLLIQAAVLLALVRAGLLLLPFRVLLRLTRRIERAARPGSGSDVPVGSIVWAVRRAGRLVPGATCLPQALTGRVLLARAGHLSELRIGVRKSAAAGFEAHAWLEHRGEVVLGELEDLSCYVPMRPAGNPF